LKKLFIFILFVSISSIHSLAQKQESGDLPIELEFSPLGANPLKISSIRTRYFLSENLAYRIGLFAGGSRKPSYTELNNIDLVNSTRNFNFTLRTGLEKHFEGTRKLSPYYGGELAFSYKKNTISTESAWISNTNEIKTQKSKSTNSTFGINLFTGADLYLTDKIFLGVEIGFGFQYEGRGRTSVNWKNPENNLDENSNKIGSSASFQWGPNYQGTIRLGYCLNNYKK
jgi:hypothetical protein